MNGFEPLRRRIIDYTEAGQWSEVYDGPLEDSESEKLKADNAKLFALLKHESEQTERLRELVRDMFDGMCDHDFDICCICPHWQEGYNGCEYHARMRELGVTDG